MTLKYLPFKACASVRSAYANAPWLKWGDSGLGVSLLQAALIESGYAMPRSTRNAGIPDGKFGNETFEKLKKFQGAMDLEPDGVAGRKTFARLDQLLTAKVEPFVKPNNSAPHLPFRPPSDHHYQLGKVDPFIKFDPGSGRFNSKPTSHSLKALKSGIQLALLHPAARFKTGRNAVRHMRHYFEATGKQLTIDLEELVKASSSGRDRFRKEVAQAKKFSEKLPSGKHQITSKSPEVGRNYTDDSKDWYYAVGGYSSWGKGTIKITDAPNGRIYDLKFEYRFSDKYNWDGGKPPTTIAKITISDEYMGEFHRQGLAQEFMCVGSLKRTFHWREGEAISDEQYLRH